uniref:Uncharacterized protein n=1 Tax=Anguilla anguilla TaxID=7936 RepID=A0A0E9QEH8_ANGAN
MCYFGFSCICESGLRENPCTRVSEVLYSPGQLLLRSKTGNFMFPLCF